MSYFNNIYLIKFGQVPDIQQLSGRQTLLAYSKALKCTVRLVIWIMPAGKHKLFFSADTSLTGEEVLDCYRTRFQIEFCFRDAKQYLYRLMLPY